MVYKEDSTGMTETWKEPYCILCEDHIDTDKHIGNVVAATNSAILKGWGQILAWLEQDVREVIEVTGHTPVDRASNNSGSSDDAALYLNLTRTIGIGPGGEPRVPSLKFQNWPSGDLEVDVSTRKKPETWVRMDPDMAAAIAEGASNGDAVFDIVVGDWKRPWYYRIDLMAWTQTNIDSGTVRALLLPTQ